VVEFREGGARVGPDEDRRLTEGALGDKEKKSSSQQPDSLAVHSRKMNRGAGQGKLPPGGSV
jgi:hypothetical protein